jgi:2'-hydroxyisoflavone reductase
MQTRRDFVARAAASTALLCAAGASAQRVEQVAIPLRILVLGGTGAIGPYHVHAAVARGHTVSVFSRGRRQADLPPSVEMLIGDRNGDLAAIRNRDWDAVIDIAAFGPGWVRSLGEALEGRVAHYTFISTVSVYDRPESRAETDEDNPVLRYSGTPDPYAEVNHVGDHYGALKALAEQESAKQFPGRACVLRPGYIGGPGDERALTYWAVRGAKGGHMLAGGSPGAPVQYIDVRDMAQWWVRMAEMRVAGIYNAVGPASALTLSQLVDTARTMGRGESQATWAPASWLNARSDAYSWGTLLFWEQGIGNIMRMSNARALANGLTTRPLSLTLQDALKWYEQQDIEQRKMLTTGFKRKEDGSGWTSARASWDEYLQREKQALAEWREAQAASVIGR